MERYNLNSFLTFTSRLWLVRRKYNCPVKFDETSIARGELA
jgi:hypothetical protein